MALIPRVSGFDQTYALWRAGYAFISNRCRALQSDVIETRLLMERAICMLGRDAAELF